MAYRYYTVMRPPAPGAIPMGPTLLRVKDWETRRDTGHGFAAWGYAEYSKALLPEQVERYELRRAK